VTVRLTVRAVEPLAHLVAAGFEASAEDAPGRPGFTRLSVRAPDGRDVSPDLYRLAVDNGWEVAELRAESPRLEEVFANLTRESRREPA
jgi:hypothetical protein